ncbi:MAG: 50S ribosomal protein L18 [Anaerolineae bacterium]|nr:50S ribosomal protein L18 [Anaerolineae bacterium]
MANVRKKNLARQRRHARVRQKVMGTPERPRLNVFRSLKHIYVQLVDDTQGNTLASASTLDPEIRARLAELPKMQQAELVGETVAQRAREKGITKVVFDRGGYAYHGRIERLAEAARKGGLEF